MVILEGSSISFIGYLMDFATDTAAPALEHIGKGIASIMLMIVLFHYLVSMLDGGKFQLRMLMPLFIFFLRLYINEKGLAKLEIAIAKGKKAYDKRETLKAKVAKSDMDRFVKNY